jgi:mRNA-degrading endonuclease RelE of RelBE toxin-antitoxin system
VNSFDFGSITKATCASERPQCLNCHNQFLALRPLLAGVVVSKRFARDLKDNEKAFKVVADVLDCSNLNYGEMHKYETKIEGSLIFRAKQEGVHMVYAIDDQLRLVFLRAFRNFTEYGKFLGNRQEIKRLIMHS